MTLEEGIGAIGELVAALQVFAQVDTGALPSGPDPRPGLDPYCWVRPARWGAEPPPPDEIWDGGSGDGAPRTRTVHFECEIHTDLATPSPTDLADLIQLAVHGQSLAGSFPAVCEAGNYTRFGTAGKAPTHRLTVTGHFTYLL